MRFADYAKIYVTAGDGGSGMAHFRREKYVPRGGPDGGDGGKGGDVILVGNEQLNTLLDLRYRKYVKAEHGKDGHTSRKTGRAGKNEVLKVPLGTVVYDADTKERLGEITHPGEKLTVAKGGQGGLGNWHFKSATNQTPQHAQDGRPGEERAIELELKLLADVGLVGFPNAGKSTLLSALTSARPKVADYPFTTLVPNLGIVDLGDYVSCTLADIPGLIEGASAGKGLGHAFLRHVERTRVLVYLLDVTDEPAERYRVLRREVERHAEHLGRARRVVCLNKVDLWPPDEALPDVHGESVLPISAATGAGVAELRGRLKHELSLAPHDLPVRAPGPSAEATAAPDPELPDDIDDF